MASRIKRYNPLPSFSKWFDEMDASGNQINSEKWVNRACLVLTGGLLFGSVACPRRSLFCALAILSGSYAIYRGHSQFYHRKDVKEQIRAFKKSEIKLLQCLKMYSKFWMVHWLAKGSEEGLLSASETDLLKDIRQSFFDDRVCGACESSDFEDWYNKTEQLISEYITPVLGNFPDKFFLFPILQGHLGTEKIYQKKMCRGLHEILKFIAEHIWFELLDEILDNCFSFLDMAIIATAHKKNMKLWDALITDFDDARSQHEVTEDETQSNHWHHVIDDVRMKKYLDDVSRDQLKTLCHEWVDLKNIGFPLCVNKIAAMQSKNYLEWEFREALVQARKINEQLEKTRDFLIDVREKMNPFIDLCTGYFVNEDFEIQVLTAAVCKDEIDFDICGLVHRINGWINLIAPLQLQLNEMIWVEEQIVKYGNGLTFWDRVKGIACELLGCRPCSPVACHS